MTINGQLGWVFKMFVEKYYKTFKGSRNRIKP